MNLHDATLLALDLDGAGGSLSIWLRDAAGDLTITCRDLRELACPRRCPWGQSTSVHEVRGPAPASEPGRQRLELALQRGDTIVVEAGDIVLERPDPAGPRHPDRLRVADLRRAALVLHRHLDDAGVQELAIEDDSYWDVRASDRYHVDRDPPDLTIGQLSDDWREVQNMIAGRRETIGYGLVWLAAVLRRVGEVSPG